MTTYFSLFLISFLSATIVPISSELTLVGLLIAEKYSSFLLIFTASLGNILGSVFNWLLGNYLLIYLKINGFLLSKIKSTKPLKGLKNLVFGLCCLPGYQ